MGNLYHGYVSHNQRLVDNATAGTEYYHFWGVHESIWSRLELGSWWILLVRDSGSDKVRKLKLDAWNLEIMERNHPGKTFYWGYHYEQVKMWIYFVFNVFLHWKKIWNRCELESSSSSLSSSSSSSSLSSKKSGSSGIHPVLVVQRVR